jgi:hypothetical protein
MTVRTVTRKTMVLAALLAASCGCNLFRFGLNPDRDAQTADGLAALPHKYQLKVSQFVFISDFEFADPHLFRELTRLQEDVFHELKLPLARASNPIQVYLFEDRDHYERFMRARYADLPMRRAFFVAQPRGMSSGDDLLVYTFMGVHLRQDLRHELTHAMLHSVLKDVPLWLDEGLAEYFELPPEAKGVNRAHIEVMRREGFAPDLARLEQLSEVQQMNPAEYREAWSWVHLMLHGNPESRQLLLAYLKQLRTTSAPGPLQQRLKQCYPEMNDALIAHISKL